MRFALAALAILAPASAFADDAARDAVEQISGAVFQAAKNRVTSFKALTGGGEDPSRKGIDFVEGDVTIQNVPRPGGNRFVHVLIPAAEKNSAGEVPHLMITAERSDVMERGGPLVWVRIPVGRKGDYPLNLMMSSQGTTYSLGTTPVSIHDAATLLEESGFVRRGQLPREARRLITALGRVKGVPAIDVANEVLKQGARQRTPRPMKTGR